MAKDMLKMAGFVLWPLALCSVGFAGYLYLFSPQKRPSLRRDAIPVAASEPVQKPKTSTLAQANVIPEGTNNRTSASLEKGISEEMPQAFFCLGMASYVRDLASAEKMAFGLRNNGKSTDELNEAKERSEKIAKSISYNIEGYQISKNLDPRYSLSDQGKYFRCGYNLEEKNRQALVDFDGGCTSALIKLAKEAGTTVELPNAKSPPIDVKRICAGQQDGRRFSIVPQGWESAEAITKLPDSIVGQWTVPGLNVCLDYQITPFKIENSDISAAYKKAGAIIVISGLPPYRVSYELSLSSDGVLRQRMRREEPDIWPGSKDFIIDLRDMVRCS